MIEYIDVIVNTISGSFRWFYRSIIFDVPWNQNYFWGLTLISLVVWGLELLFPWRKEQKVFRKDFWLDALYMYFNFFVFSSVISGLYVILGNLFSAYGMTIHSMALIDVNQLPAWLGLLVFFVLLDFVQWFTHIALHKVPFFWQFHKVHHSVKEMGFAAHLRYHWMENILYKPLKTLAIMLLGGFEPEQAFVVHFISIAIGHLNHANLALDWGPLKYLINNPVMHLYHHAKSLPKGRFGVNFGISLSIWDYLFNTYYLPKKNPHLTLGFDGDENFPKDFINQNLSGFKK